MFGRSNPATSTCGRSRPSSATMSSRTSGVAVAVNAARASAVAIAGSAERRRHAQPPVVWTEVVTPFGDTVRFVDHEAGDLQPAKQSQELIRRESFGRDVQQAEPSGS